jgi:hypothetical protein
MIKKGINHTVTPGSSPIHPVMSRPSDEEKVDRMAIQCLDSTLSTQLRIIWLSYEVYIVIR